MITQSGIVCRHEHFKVSKIHHRLCMHQILAYSLLQGFDFETKIITRQGSTSPRMSKYKNLCACRLASFLCLHYSSFELYFLPLFLQNSKRRGPETHAHAYAQTLPTYPSSPLPQCILALLRAAPLFGTPPLLASVQLSTTCSTKSKALPVLLLPTGVKGV
ncbi:hypothetical protein DL89DRAFT_25328 [Linderina pennispora]|uniref:Uncharacterized protein n=1 Tax=Linderina pennispora TaxID=61395 RepID=A0A1Y1WND1_9FUNG|nr:uncharacterized protein DL89DRAFT_25328 [Linderina pennispora]ORX74962.1 hypothetical protein DL89DRAFT_25328 [Linderina pennispora]